MGAPGILSVGSKIVTQTQILLYTFNSKREERVMDIHINECFILSLNEKNSTGHVSTSKFSSKPYFLSDVPKLSYTSHFDTLSGLDRRTGGSFSDR